MKNRLPDSVLPDALLARAVSLASAGVDKVAWTREDARKVLRCTREAGLIVLGGDLWRLDGDRWGPTYENWFCNLRPAESAEAACARSHDLADSFVDERMGGDAVGTWVTMVIVAPVPHELPTAILRRVGDPLTPLELRALEKLTGGKSEILAILREQLEVLFAGPRHMTGCGFFRDLHVPADVPRLTGEDRRLVVGDVGGRIHGMDQYVGFLLFVRDGAMTMLEGYFVGEEWPERVGDFDLNYERARALDPAAFRS